MKRFAASLKIDKRDAFATELDSTPAIRRDLPTDASDFSALRSVNEKYLQRGETCGQEWNLGVLRPRLRLIRTTSIPININGVLTTCLQQTIILLLRQSQCKYQAGNLWMFPHPCHPRNM